MTTDYNEDIFLIRQNLRKLIDIEIVRALIELAKFSEEFPGDKYKELIDNSQKRIRSAMRLD